MVALTQDRNTDRRSALLVNHPAGATAKIFAGALVVLNASGYAVPGSTATTLTAVGRANEQVDNSSGADGDQTVEVERGVFQYANDGSINRTHIGKTLYIVDDQTLSATDGTGTRSAAGKCIDVDADGVWVELG